MKNIRISDGLYRVNLATDAAWVERVAHIAMVGGLEYSLVPQRADWGINILVSEISSGALLYKEWIDPFTFATCDTKEKTLVVLKEVVENSVLKIEEYSSEELNSKISEALKKSINVLGPMPKNKIPYFEEVSE